MNLFVVNGYYYFNENTFDIGLVEPKVFKTAEEANDYCKREFYELIKGTYFEDYENDNEVEVEECFDETDSTIGISIHNTDNGERIVLEVNKVKLD